MVAEEDAEKRGEERGVHSFAGSYQEKAVDQGGAGPPVVPPSLLCVKTGVWFEFILLGWRGNASHCTSKQVPSPSKAIQTFPLLPTPTKRLCYEKFNPLNPLTPPSSTKPPATSTNDDEISIYLRKPRPSWVRTRDEGIVEGSEMNQLANRDFQY